MKYIFAIILVTFWVCGYSQGEEILKVHFLYGSKPKNQHIETEAEWFGGLHGGHVGIEVDSNRIFNFVPKGEFHIVSHPKNRHSSFAIHPEKRFYSIFGSHPDSVKRSIVYIKITDNQREKLDSIVLAYMKQTPYDYAFFGMRCASATRDVLSQIGLLKPYGKRKTRRKAFYPKKLRKELFEMAKIYNWMIKSYPGTKRRKWEND